MGGPEIAVELLNMMDEVYFVNLFENIDPDRRAFLGLSVVIGISMVFSMIIAGMSGAVIPVTLKAFGQDPAQSSSIILTTVTEVFGFLSFLGLAKLMADIFGIA